MLSTQAHSPIKPVLVFVSSRRQTRLTALDLIGYAAADERPRQFVHCPEEELEEALASIKACAMADVYFEGMGGVEGLHELTSCLFLTVPASAGWELAPHSSIWHRAASCWPQRE